MLKGYFEDFIVDSMIFGWVIYGGEDYVDNKFMYIKEVNEYE